MRAAVIPQWGQLSKSPKWSPQSRGPGEVRVRIGGSGACHSDLHVKGGELGDLGFTEGRPKILGHENAGCVDAVDEGALPDWTSASRWRCSVVGLRTLPVLPRWRRATLRRHVVGRDGASRRMRRTLYCSRCAWPRRPAPGPAAGQVRRNTVRGWVSGVRSTVDVR